MIRTEDAGRLRVVTLDRPARRNALRSADLEALATAVEETDASVVYLHGAGSAFCAGADLEEVAALSDPAAFAERGQRTARALASADAAVVAGVDGAARGGGVELALACDLRVATPDATFAEPGVALGLFGAWGGTVRLPAIVGRGNAADLSLTGRVVDAEEALRMGLVSQVRADPRAVATAMAEHPPDAVRAVARRLRDDSPVAEREAAEAGAFASLVRTHAPSLGRGREDGDDAGDDRDGADGDGEAGLGGDGEAGLGGDGEAGVDVGTDAGVGEDEDTGVGEDEDTDVDEEDEGTEDGRGRA